MYNREYYLNPENVVSKKHEGTNTYSYRFLKALQLFIIKQFVNIKLMIDLLCTEFLYHDGSIWTECSQAKN